MFFPLLTTKAQGKGFSLAICKRIVDCHGGKIAIESLPDMGATIRINLPIKPRITQEKAETLISKPDPLLHYDTKANHLILSMTHYHQQFTMIARKL